MSAVGLPVLYGTGLSGLLCEPGWGLWVCVQVVVLCPAVFCWMVPDRGVATVAVIHFLPLLCFSWAFWVSAVVMAPMIQSMIGCGLFRSLLPLFLLGCGDSCGGGLSFSLSCTGPGGAAPLNLGAPSLCFVPSFVWGTSDFWWPSPLFLCS